MQHRPTGLYNYNLLGGGASNVCKIYCALSSLREGSRLWETVLLEFCSKVWATKSNQDGDLSIILLFYVLTLFHYLVRVV